MNDFLVDIDEDANIWDVKVENGDFVVGDATEQNQGILLVCNKNDVKAHPTICVGARSYMDDEGPENLIRSIRKEYVKDGMTVNRLSMNTATGRIEIDAPYL